MGTIHSLQEVQETLDAVARFVAPMAPTLRAGWVIYILEALENLTADAETTTATLHSLIAGIRTRLEEGRW